MYTNVGTTWLALISIKSDNVGTGFSRITIFIVILFAYKLTRIDILSVLKIEPKRTILKKNAKRINIRRNKTLGVIVELGIVALGRRLSGRTAAAFCLHDGFSEYYTQITILQRFGPLVFGRVPGFTMLIKTTITYTVCNTERTAQ